MRYILIDAQMTGCGGEIRLNDIPAGRIATDGGRYASIPLNPLAVPRANRLSVFLHPRAGETFPADAKVTIRLVSSTSGSLPDVTPPTSLFDLIWRANGGETPPLVLTAEGMVEPAVAPPEWLGCSRLSLDQATLNQVARATAALLRAFEGGDYATIVRIAEPRLKTVARTMGMDLNELRADLQRTVVGMSRRAAGAWMPFNPQDVDFRLCGDGRMIDCVAKDWKPLIRTDVQRSGIGFTFAMRLGLLPEGWRIVL